MSRKPRGSNPFYALLLIVGVAFTLTACSYGVLAFRQASPASDPIEAEDASLMGILDRYGVWILCGEVLLLGVLSVAAIGSDELWQRRAQRLQQNEADGSTQPADQQTPDQPLAATSADVSQTGAN